MIGPLLLLACAGVHVTPVQKVVQMMQAMQQKAEQEKADEAKAFATYSEWCEDTSVARQYAIKSGAAQIERQSATAEKNSVAAAALADAMADLDGQVSVWQSELAKATEERAAEHRDFKVLFADYEESVDALGRALAVLKSRSADVPQALLQVSQAVPRARKALAAYLQFTPPEADGYEFQSGGVVDTIAGLLRQFREEKNGVQKDEMNAKHGFDMMALSLNDSISHASKEHDTKAAAQAGHLEAKAEAEAKLAAAQTAKQADEVYLKDLIAQCETKKVDFESRQTLRGQEIEALAKAIDIIGSGSVAGKADKHLPSLIQKKAFVQFLGAATSPARQRASLILVQSGSKELAQLAAKVAAGDPFDKVVSMIKGLLIKLQEEAAAEADHKGWCDGELKTNKLTREEKTEQTNSLRAAVDALQAEIATLVEQQAELASAVKELDSALAEATKLRQAEKAKNKETIADAAEAQHAVQQALKILKDFYQRAAGATALTQQSPAEDAPPSFTSPYTGNQSGKEGVVGMIEVIGADFARLEADSKSSEATAQREFDQFSAETAADKAAKVADGKAQQKSQTAKERDLSATQDDLRSVEAELDAALRYYDELKPACLEAGVSYGDRKARREDEVASLNEAYKILSGEA